MKRWAFAFGGLVAVASVVIAAWSPIAEMGPTHEETTLMEVTTPRPSPTSPAGVGIGTLTVLPDGAEVYNLDWAFNPGPRVSRARVWIELQHASDIVADASELTFGSGKEPLALASGWTPWTVERPLRLFLRTGVVGSRRAVSVTKVEVESQGDFDTPLPLEPGKPMRGFLQAREPTHRYSLAPGAYTLFLDRTECGCADVVMRLVSPGVPDALIGRVGDDVNLFRAATIPPETTIEITSRGGTGCYTLVASPIRRTLTTNAWFTPGRWNDAGRVEATVIYTDAAAHLLASTDGMVLLAGGSFNPPMPTWIHVVMSELPADAHIPFAHLCWPWGVITLYRGNTGADLAHELGHAELCLPDEYNETRPPPDRQVEVYCDNSMMARDQVRKLCWSDNHRTAAKAASGSAAWPALTGTLNIESAKGTRSPNRILYEGISNAIFDSMTFNGCAGCTRPVFPAAFPNDGLDADRNGVKDCLDSDSDGDGEGDATDCAPSDPTVHEGVDADRDAHVRAGCGGEDCDDADASTFPGAPEVCDGRDQSCDGQSDETFPDTDGDRKADCVDTNDDNDCVFDVADNCPTRANCDNAQAVLDTPFFGALGCVDPCRPAPFLVDRLNDAIACMARKDIPRQCMLKGCSPRDLGLAGVDDLLVGAGLATRGPTGVPQVIVPTLGARPSAEACALVAGGLAQTLDRARRFEAQCRADQRALPSYAACQRDTNLDHVGDACQ